MASGSLQNATPERRREIAILGCRASLATRDFHRFVVNWIAKKTWLMARIRSEYEIQKTMRSTSEAR